MGTRSRSTANDSSCGPAGGISIGLPGHSSEKDSKCSDELDHESTRSELAGAKNSFQKDDSRALLEHKSIKPKNKARNYPQSRRIQNHKMAKKAVKAATMHRMRPTQTRRQQLPFALLSGPKGFIEKTQGRANRPKARLRESRHTNSLLKRANK